MIHDVDESLRALVRRDVLNGTKIDVSFDAPNKEWAGKRQGPALNLYLYDVHEDVTRRRAQYEERRNEVGRVVDRVMPPRRFRLSYLVTAWTQRPEDEHRLLSAMLACFLSLDQLPRDVLQGALAELAESGEGVRSTIGLPLPPERSLSDVWTALGGELKPSLDLVVVVPFPALTPRERHVGPPVLEEPRVALRGPEGSEADEAVGRGRRARKGGKTSGDRQPAGVGARASFDNEAPSGDPSPGSPGAGAPSGAGGGHGSGTGAGDGTEAQERTPTAEETVQGGKPGAQSGRRIVVRKLPRQ